MQPKRHAEVLRQSGSFHASTRKIANEISNINHSYANEVVLDKSFIEDHISNKFSPKIPLKNYIEKSHIIHEPLSNLVLSSVSK